MAIRQPLSKSVENLKKTVKNLRYCRDELKKKIASQSRTNAKNIRQLTHTMAMMAEEIVILKTEKEAIANQCYKEIAYSELLQKEIDEMMQTLRKIDSKKADEQFKKNILREYNGKN